MLEGLVLVYVWLGGSLFFCDCVRVEGTGFEGFVSLCSVDSVVTSNFSCEVRLLHC